MKMTKTELYFGLSIGTGKAVVSNIEFDHFVDNYISPRFPDGLTVLDAVGQYRMESGLIVSEHTKLVILLHDDRNNDIDIIRRTYCNLFNQESVMMIDGIVNVAF